MTIFRDSSKLPILHSTLGSTGEMERPIRGFLGSVQGSVDFVDGVVPGVKAMSITGKSNPKDGVVYNIPPTRKITVEYYFMIPSGTATDKIHVAHYVQSSHRPAIYIGVSRRTSFPDEIEFYVQLTATAQKFYIFGRDASQGPDIPLVNDTWYHFAVTVDCDTEDMKFYVDGDEKVQYTTAPRSDTTSSSDWSSFAGFDMICPGYNDSTSSTYSGDRVISNFKVFPYIKTDFSDSLSLAGNKLYGTNITKNLTERTLLHSTLGSENEIEFPLLGNQGTVNGSLISYNPCKFGNGIQLNSSSEYVSFPSAIRRERGTIEFWFKPGFSSTSTTRWSIIDTNTSTNRMVLYWYEAVSRFRFGVTSIGNSNCDAVTFAVNDVFHLALVWDEDGIEGSGDYARVYYNGSQIGANTNSISGSSFSEDITLAGWEDSTPAYSGNGVFENVKIHNYAKIDFSDRFTKYPGGIKTNIVELNTGTKKSLFNKLSSDNEIRRNGGVIPGTSSYGTGYFGDAYDTQGVAANYLDFSAWNNINISGKGTIEIRFTLDNITSYHTLVNLYSSGLPYVSITLPYSDSRLALKVYDGTYARMAVLPTGLIEAGTSYHVAAVWDSNGIDGSGNYLRVYLDNVLVAYSDNFFNSFDIDGSISVGAFLSGGVTPINPMNGISEYFRLSNYTKTDFSDYQREFEIKNSGITFYTNPDKKLIIENKLCSDDEVERIGGTVVGTSLYDSGKFGYAYNPNNNSSNYLDFDVAATKVVPGKGTYELWVNLNSTGTQVLIHGRNITSPKEIRMTIESNKLSANYFDGGTVARVDGLATFPTSQWVHIAYCWDMDGIDGSSDTLRLYQDGVLQDTSTDVKSDFEFESLQVGTYIVSRIYPIDGLLENFKVYNYAKTDFSDREIQNTPIIDTEIYPEV